MVKFVNTNGATTDRNRNPRERLIGAKSKFQQVGEPLQQPPKKNKVTTAAGCDGSTDTKASQDNNGAASSTLNPTTTTTYDECNHDGMSGGVDSRKGEGKKRKGEADYEEVGNDGKPCRTQKFRMNPPAEEYILATDSGGSEDEWCRGVDGLMHQDHLNDIAWWCEVEAAIEADGRKRRIEEGSARAARSKRPKKPG